MVGASGLANSMHASANNNNNPMYERNWTRGVLLRACLEEVEEQLLQSMRRVHWLNVNIVDSYLRYYCSRVHIYSNRSVPPPCPVSIEICSNGQDDGLDGGVGQGPG